MDQLRAHWNANKQVGGCMGLAACIGLSQAETTSLAGRWLVEVGDSSAAYLAAGSSLARSL